MKPSHFLVAGLVLVALFFLFRSGDGTPSVEAPSVEALSAQRLAADSEVAPSPVGDLTAVSVGTQERERADSFATRVDEGAADAPAAPTPTRLAVRVVDQHGTPLSGMRVTVHGADDSSVDAFLAAARQEGQTDREGSVALEVRPDTALIAFASSSAAYARPALAEHPGVAEGETGELELVALVPEGAFHGLVLAVEDGRPLPGVSIHASEPSTFMTLGDRPGSLWNTGAATATTDAGGRFELALDEWGDGLAIASSDDRSAVLFEVDEDSFDPERPKTLRLQRAARLVGRVDGLPVGPPQKTVRIACKRYHLAAGESMRILMGADAGWSVPIEPDGRFAVEGLPPEVPLDASIEQMRSVLLNIPEPLTLVPGETREVHWEVGRGATVRVLALDGAGAPQADLDLDLFAGSELHGNWIEPYDVGDRRLRTDADGRALVEDVAPGEWAIGPSPPGGAGGAGGGAQDAAPLATRFTVAPGAGRVDVELLVHRGLTIRGRVVGPDGEQVASANVSASLSAERVHINENIAEDGTFVLGPLPRGRFVLSARPYGNPEWRAAEPVEVLAGAEGVELRLRRGGGVTVRIVDSPGGELLAGAVSIYPVDDAGHYQVTRTNEASEFVLGGLEAGLYHVTATARDGRIGVLRDVEILTGLGAGPFDILVEPAGQVRVRYSGPAEHANYSIHQDGVIFGRDGVRTGTSAVHLAPTGSVTVLLELRPGGTGADGEPLKIERSRSVTVARGEETLVEFEIEE